MKQYRFNNYKEALDFLMKNRQMTNQEATHFLWQKSFTMGTDKGVWIDLPYDVTTL